MAKGIAAVFDAVFLLIIASIASGILLSVTYGYGSSFERHAKGVLMNYYAKQVVKALVTASIERDGVPDYLLSYLKESIEAGRDMTELENMLKDIVTKAMEPVRDRYDYVVSLKTENGSIFICNDNIIENDPLDNYFGPRYSSSTKIYMDIKGRYVPITITVTLTPRGILECP